ncbi:MAG: glycoside hydrolase family 2 protein [Clostridiales bacterium]|nr:glycoside hydrolase family 2 protein [Clostridiales bacterium]
MKQLSLNGLWRMGTLGESWEIDAQVPGSVYHDLLTAGRMPDPFYRENELEVFPLMEKDYRYYRTFQADEALLACDALLLRCEGLDTLAEIRLNDETVARVDNMHRTWEFDVSELVRLGENRLEILFFSPLRYIAREWDKRPSWGSTDATPGFQHLRKAHCMFGWDWGPRLPDAGIWRNISLLGVEKARLSGVQVLQEHGEGKVLLSIEPELETYALGTQSALEFTVTVTGPDGRVFTPSHRGGLTVSIVNPALWWPSGYGDQPLYTVRVELLHKGQLLDAWERRIGLRTLGISRQEDEWGEEFCHVVNGLKIFAMGADYIPEDNLLPRVNPSRTRRLLEDARLAHFNCIRVWGGGCYPDDFFYDLCDELGLLVWQDFMYACAYYDLTPEFEQSIRAEAVDNIKRLRHHPSLALWCGNNEMEMFQHDALRYDQTEALLAPGQPHPFGPRKPSHMADYFKMFEYILPQLCGRLDPQRFYWPASPSSGGAFDRPNDPDRGDVHYWDVWHGEKPFTEYRKFHFRYASEFGFQSFPCLATVEQFTLPEDRNIFSRVMERHQRNGAANGKILNYLSQTYLYPYDFDSLLYASQLLQADAIRCGVEHWRRFRGRCMGAVIWQLNDCWPVASWSSIDYYGRWKALHYAAKRFFAPVLLSACEENEVTQNPRINEFRREPIAKTVALCVTNDTTGTVSGRVRWALRSASAQVIREGFTDVTVEPLSALWLPRMDFADADLTSHYVSYDWEVEGKWISGGTVLFCAPKHFGFEEPGLTVQVQGDEIVVTARAFARFVEIRSQDADMLLDDNFFEMNGGERRVKVLRGEAKGLSVRSAYNIGRQTQETETTAQ